MENGTSVSPTPAPKRSVDFLRSRLAMKTFSSSLLEILPEALRTGDFSAVESLIERFDVTAVDDDESAWERVQEDVDGWFRRQVLAEAVRGDAVDVEFCRNVVRLVSSTTSGRGGGAPVFSPTLPCSLLSDVLDVVTVDAAEAVFGVLEEFREVWKSPPFVESNKNVILRLCNNLLKRLSKSQNTDLCSRVLLLLAAVLPPSERSGLNVIGEFNLENVTPFSAGGDEKNGPKLPEITETKELEGKMYETFWSLQDFFRNPMQLVGTNFKKFKDSCDEVFRLFRTYRLESVSSAKTESAPNRAGVSKIGGGRGGGFFAKYLTNRKLMDLEMRDSTFRRSFLTQFMIVAQFHLLPCKFRSEKNQLSGSQRHWLKKSSKLTLRLIRETPPDGPRAARFLRKVLKDERRWITWKNTGCKPAVPVTEVSEPAPQSGGGEPTTEPSTEEAESRPPAGGGLGTESILARARRLKAILSAADASSGQSPMRKLCALPTRGHNALSRFGAAPPSIEAFCADALEHVDEKVAHAGSESLLADPTFTWRAMRLMRAKSASFFAASASASCGVVNPLSVTDTLKQLLITAKAEKVEKEKTISAAPSPPANKLVEGDEDGVDSAGVEGVRSPSPTSDEEGNEDGGGGESGGAVGRGQETPLTDELVVEIVPKIGEGWMALGKRLQYKKTELEHFQTEAKGDTLDAAKLLLRNWMENEDDPTLENLTYWCDAVGIRI